MAIKFPTGAGLMKHHFCSKSEKFLTLVFKPVANCIGFESGLYFAKLELSRDDRSIKLDEKELTCYIFHTESDMINVLKR